MIDLNELQVFYWVGKLGGVGAAARKLQVTQPAVSHRLRALEKELGRKLYGRVENRIVLTEAGESLLRSCSPALESLANVDASVRDRPAGLEGLVRIVALSEFAKVFLLPRLRRFLARHPRVRFAMEYRAPYEMPPLLLERRADIIFGKELQAKPQVEARRVFTEEYVLVGPKPARRFSWKDLETLSWLSCRSEDNYWHELQQRVIRQGARLPAPVVEIVDIESLIALAAEGAGYALVPLHAVRLRRAPGLAIHKLPGPPIKEEILACRLRTVPLGAAAAAFWDEVVA